MRAAARSPSSALTSRPTTSTPPWIPTCAIPAPIVPSPTTPTLRISLGTGRSFHKRAGGLELLLAEPDVRVAPEALREDARRLDGRRVVQVGDDGERPDLEPPRPALARRVALGVADDLDHAVERLPHRGVEDREVAALHCRTAAARRAVAGDRRRVDPRVERPVAAAAHEQPASQAGFRASTHMNLATPWPGSSKGTTRASSSTKPAASS